MSVSFLIGLALALPLAIAGNLATPLAQRALASTSARARRRLDHASKRRREQAERRAEDPAELSRYAFERLTTIGLAIASVLLAGLVVAFEARFGRDNSTRKIVYLLAGGLAFVALNIALLAGFLLFRALWDVDAVVEERRDQSAGAAE